MSKDFGTVLNEKASKILAKVTDGKYTRLLIEDSLKLILLSEGRRIPAERVSRGTVEQVILRFEWQLLRFCMARKFR